ncbi:MAG: phosphate ABC transporter substrate-binding protein PstS family protein [Actinomycetota bacterium]
MRNVRKTAGIVAGVLAFSLIAAACGGSNDGGSGGTGGTGGTGATGGGLSGSITISGSSTVLPISNLVAELFSGQNPDVQVSVDGPGTGDGFVLFCKGETDISDASRPIADDEKAACSKAGIDYVEIPVAFDGITVMTNPQNDAVTCLNSGDLYALFGPGSEGFKTWADADSLAQKVGGNGGFADVPLEITAPGAESGTYDAFIELSGITDIALAQGLTEDQSATLRPDYQSSPDDNVIIQAMEGSASALGFVGFAYAEGAADQIKIIQIDGGSGCVEPSRETIADGSYPLSRTLYIYVNKAKIASSPALKAFVDLYVSDDGIKTAVQQAGYVDLPDDQIATSRSTWDSASA